MTDYSPEAFGAKGNGVTDDKAAIQKCLDTHGQVMLGPKTYAVDGRYGGIAVRDDALIRGYGPRTTIRTEGDDDHGAGWTVAFQSDYDSDVPTHNAVIKDLQIDCGFGLFQDNYFGRQAINLRGFDNLIENVKVFNFGPGRVGSECFVMTLQAHPKKDSGLSVGTIRNCEFSNPGENKGVHYGSKGSPEITCLFVQGVDNDHTMGGALIEGNRFIDFGANTIAPLHGISPAKARNVIIERNFFQGFDGAAVFLMCGQTDRTIIRGNTVFDTNQGIIILINGAWDKGNEGVHSNLVVEGNTFSLGKRTTAKCQRGINILIGSVPNSPQLSGLDITRNQFTGRRFDDTGSIPVGICLAIQVPNGFEAIRVRDNFFDLPDYGYEFDLKTPHENSVAFFTQDCFVPGKIMMKNNTDAMAGEVGLKIVSQDYSSSSILKGILPGAAIV